MERDPLLIVQGLKKYYPVTLGGFLRRRKAAVKAVDGVSLAILPGETFGLVGESGCGKSTLGRCLLRLEEPTAGRVVFQGREVGNLAGRELRDLRREMQIVFQDPYSSLDPRQTVRRILSEPFRVHGVMDRADRPERLGELMAVVGLRPEHLNRYPHEFSGGQRQRICIARALALNPSLIIADEPVSALDVSIQAQILNLLVELQRRFDLTYIFISHDLSVVRHLSDRVGVMYLGRIVELAKSRELYARPLHPYTQALLSAVPQPNPERRRKRTLLSGDVPSPINPPPGCPFHPRCHRARPDCLDAAPDLADVTPGHAVACRHPG